LPHVFSSSSFCSDRHALLSFPTRRSSDLIAFAKAMRQTHPNLPLAFNYSSSFRWSSDANPFLFRELGDLGYKFIFITLYAAHAGDRKSTRLNSSHQIISYAVFCLKKKTKM